MAAAVVGMALVGEFVVEGPQAGLAVAIAQAGVAEQAAAMDR
jgi:hypothetical protein